MDKIKSWATDPAAASVKRFLKRLLAEANAQGLDVYCELDFTGEIMLGVSIGDCLANDAPGRLVLSVNRDRIKIKCLKINGPVVVNDEMLSCYKLCSLVAMKKFGWEECAGYEYSSPENTFEFRLSMLSDWLKKLKTQQTKSHASTGKSRKIAKKAEIEAERVQEID